MSKRPKLIRRETYTYGYLDLCEDKVIVHPATYATEEQKALLHEDATLYAALANRPVKIETHDSNKDSA